VVNGGTYYQPTLVDKTGQRDGQLHQNQPKVVHQHVVSQQVSSDIRDLMQNVITKNYLTYGMTRPNPSYNIGGKTGTAEIARPSGGYYEDRFNGTFMGFVGGNEPQYVVFVRVNQPQIGGYAGSKAAAPIFGNTITMPINNFGVTPKE
jgi:cell division protein FtsI/penicillin-binding protein 2